MLTDPKPYGYVPPEREGQYRRPDSSFDGYRSEVAGWVAVYTQYQLSTACAERDARIAELTQQLADARKQMEAQKDEWLSWEAKRRDLEKDAERWKAHMSSGDSHSPTCRKCGHSYTPDDFDTEDCPRCEFDSVDAAIKEQT